MTREPTSEGAPEEGSEEQMDSEIEALVKEVASLEFKKCTLEVLRDTSSEFEKNYNAQAERDQCHLD